MINIGETIKSVDTTFGVIMINKLKSLLEFNNNQHHIVDWSEYIYYGLFFSILLSFLNKDTDGFYQIIVVLFFFVLAGLKESVGDFVLFIKRYPILPIVAAIYSIYYFLNKTDPVSHRFALVALFVVFGGFCAAVNCEGELDKIYGKLWMILFAFLLIDIFTIRDKAPLYFKDPMLELSIIIFFGVLTFLYMNDNKMILAGEALIIFLGVMLFRSNEMHFERAWKIKKAMTAFMEGNLLQKVLGTGFLQVKSNNTFAGLLAYYGIVAAALLCLVVIYAIYLLITSKDKDIKKQSVLVLVTLLCSAFYPAFLLIDGAYLIFAQIGIFLGQAEALKDKGSH